MRAFKATLIVLTLAIGVAAIALYKGDLPKAVVDARYSNEALRFLVLDSGARIHYRDEGNRSEVIINNPALVAQ